MPWMIYFQQSAVVARRRCLVKRLLPSLVRGPQDIPPQRRLFEVFMSCGVCSLDPQCFSPDLSEDIEGLRQVVRSQCANGPKRR